MCMCEHKCKVRRGTPRTKGSVCRHSSMVTAGAELDRSCKLYGKPWRRCRPRPVNGEGAGAAVCLIQSGVCSFDDRRNYRPYVVSQPGLDRPNTSSKVESSPRMYLICRCLSMLTLPLATACPLIAPDRRHLESIYPNSLTNSYLFISFYFKPISKN